ncbi:MAG TPA: helix-turn-helix domain-containing protein [Bdellovibrionota bacterium]|nr:helix-turn-helix domain-containing protein [Bdellovibrionota bacterium]
MSSFASAQYGVKPKPLFENGIGRLLTVSDVAKLLQCSERTIRNMVSEGRIPTVRPTPRMVRFHSDVLRRWLSERSHPYG